MLVIQFHLETQGSCKQNETYEKIPIYLVQWLMFDINSFRNWVKGNNRSIRGPYAEHTISHDTLYLKMTVAQQGFIPRNLLQNIFKNKCILL